MPLWHYMEEAFMQRIKIKMYKSVITLMLIYMAQTRCFKIKESLRNNLLKWIP